MAISKRREAHDKASGLSWTLAMALKSSQGSGILQSLLEG